MSAHTSFLWAPTPVLYPFLKAIQILVLFPHPAAMTAWTHSVCFCPASQPTPTSSQGHSHQDISEGFLSSVLTASLQGHMLPKT